LALLLNAQNLSKTYGSLTLFENINFTVDEGARVGLIGPNGSGKSTLMQILAGMNDPDVGEVALRKRVTLAYVAQEPQFASGDTIRSVILRTGQSLTAPEVVETLGRAGFEDLDPEVASLSGGWRKRVAIVEALVRQPDILLLDEPTNHLDLAGILWLEKLLAAARFACVVVSHDRYFLENVATEMMELNRAYQNGLLRATGNYSTFLEKKADYLHALAKRQDALENLVRTEMEWLRRGPKARTTKSKARIDKAHEMISELADLDSRTRTASTDIDFSATDRKTKRLIELDKVGFSIGGRTLFENVDFTVTAGVRVGLVGPNGSGKTTLLRLFMEHMSPTSGTIRRADALRTVYFDQNRRLDPEVSLRRSLAPEGDSVVYQDRVLHVAGWAARFLFTADQLNQPVGKLSGGERARVLIARLMLEPADVLLLDEPTNDLDIPTLEILEESLLEFRGAMVLVTHDRFLLGRVSTVVLGLDGEGGCERFADYSQWEEWQESRKKVKSKEAVPSPAVRSAPPKKKLSYIEAREYEAIEQKVAAAEELLEQKRQAMHDPAIVSDGRALQDAYAAVEKAQADVDKLYERWAELEEKKG
jgi:ATP-binding cassette subfamily F protein uup